jgi:glycerate 2-kinase
MGNLKTPSPGVRILVAPDKFKGSLTAAEAADAIREGIERELPDSQIECLPLADGGEGSAEIFIKRLDGALVECESTDALDRPVRTFYGWSPARRLAVIEMSAASGLWRLSELERNPFRTTTHGTGTLLLDAVRRGATNILVALGGSATNDAGAGLAAALGYRFLDVSGHSLDPLPENFPAIARIEKPNPPFAPEVVALADVQNPLLGPNGASRIYGLQKGATPAQVETLETALCHFADIVARDCGHDFRDTPGAGAAGGLGFGLMSFCGAAIRPGFETFAAITHLADRIAAADVIVTGEGRLDASSLEGKGPGTLARFARASGKNVILLVGSVEDGFRIDDLCDACFALAESPATIDESVRDARFLLVRAAGRAAKLLALPQNQ